VGRKWCDVVDCGSSRKRVDFLPVEGNAVFWGGFDEDRVGREEVCIRGCHWKGFVKYGLNIWTRQK